jgi:hypothetical protein
MRFSVDVDHPEELQEQEEDWLVSKTSKFTISSTGDSRANDKNPESSVPIQTVQNLISDSRSTETEGQPLSSAPVSSRDQESSSEKSQSRPILRRKDELSGGKQRKPFEIPWQAKKKNQPWLLLPWPRAESGRSVRNRSLPCQRSQEDKTLPEVDARSLAEANSNGAVTFRRPLKSNFRLKQFGSLAFPVLQVRIEVCILESEADSEIYLLSFNRGESSLIKHPKIFIQKYMKWGCFMLLIAWLSLKMCRSFFSVKFKCIQVK